MPMTLRNIPRLRLRSQRLAGARCQTAGDVVTTMGAMQAQDYLGALWSVGLRMASATERNIEQALAERLFVRTWPMRGTLHFVAAADARWMLTLCTPRVIAASTGRCRELELDAKIFARAEKLFVKALRGGRQLTRDAMHAVLERAGIATAEQRGYHILWRLAQEQVICFGPRAGKQQTFVLLDEWLPKTRNLSREESLAELARRYFTSHGPATLADFAWWSGLKMTEARAGLETVATHLAKARLGETDYWFASALMEEPDNSVTVHLLPGFDEYLLGYTDRSAVLEARHAPKLHPGTNGMFLPAMLSSGCVVGVWKRTLKKQGGAEITHRPFGKLKRPETLAFANACESYGNFLEGRITVA